MTRSLAAAVLALVALASCGQASSGYDDDVERQFVTSCATGASTRVCQCIYDKVVDDVPFDDFEALDERRKDDPGYLSPALRRFAVDCATEAVLRGT